jgi:hypothetical protein
VVVPGVEGVVVGDVVVVVPGVERVVVVVVGDVVVDFGDWGAK